MNFVFSFSESFSLIKRLKKGNYSSISCKKNIICNKHSYVQQVIHHTLGIITLSVAWLNFRLIINFHKFLLQNYPAVNDIFGFIYVPKSITY